DSIGQAMKPPAPLFTRPVQRGVGLAEEPRTGESFGMHRCRLSAEGIVRTWLAGDQSVDGRLRGISAQFAGAGFDLRRPHLGHGAADFEALTDEVAYVEA